MSSSVIVPSGHDLDIVKTSLTEALYAESDLAECVLHFATSMIKTEWPNSLFISKLSTEMRQSAKIRRNLRSANGNIIEEMGIASALIIENLCPMVKFSIEAREKTLFSEVNKRICKLTEKGTAQIQDLLALRIIILNDDTEANNIARCYDIGNRLLDHYSLAHPTVDTGLSWDISVKDTQPLKDNSTSVQKKIPGLLIPDKSGLYPIFERMAKDYIRYPQSNGYQSLQFICVYKGIPLEIQIRSVSMHHWATVGGANHGVYKSTKTYQGINLDMFNEDKIKMPKYLIDDDDLITYPGLVNAIQWFWYCNN